MLDTLTKPFEISMPFNIRTYDINFAGIVSNIVYHRWLEDMRLDLIEQHLPLDSILKDHAPALASTQIDYLKPLTLFDSPVGSMWVSKLGRARLILKAEFISNGEVVTSATQTIVFVRLDTMRPVPIPPGMKAAYDRQIASEVVV